LLRHFASHGFIVAAANTGSAGNGEAMLAGLDNLTTFNGQSGNRFFYRVDLTLVGTSGHSQGGGGAEEAAEDSRVDATVPFEPWLGEAGAIVGSAFFMAGQTDGIVSSSSVEADFDDAYDIPAAFGELAGAGHFEPTGDGGGFRGAATAWAHWQLIGDRNGRGLFVGSNCRLCTSSAWSDYQANDLLQGSQPPDPDPDPDPDPPVRHCDQLAARGRRAGRHLLHLRVRRGKRRLPRLPVDHVVIARDLSRLPGRGRQLLTPDSSRPAG
jgi:hypothetical protein